MTDEVVPLDGNAAAGPLAALFAVEPTTIMITCASCGREGPLGTLRLYGGAMGMILRCPECGTANLRFSASCRAAMFGFAPSSTLRPDSS